MATENTRARPALVLVGALVLVVLLALPYGRASAAGPLASVAQLVQQPAEPVAAPAAQVRITELTPTTVTPEDTVDVDVEVTNTSAEPLKNVTLTLGIVRYKLSSETILENWFSGAEQIIAPSQLDSVELEDELAPGSSRVVRLSAPATDLRLLEYRDAAGPRGLTVSLTDSASGLELSSAKTFLLWFPSEEIEPLRLSILTPLTGPAPSPLAPDAWGKRIAETVGAEGRLRAALDVTRAHKDVTWVVDPELVDAASRGLAGDDGVAWASDLLRAATGREVFALNPFDPDVTALAAAGLSPVLGARGGAAYPSGWRDDLTLPATDVVDMDTFSAAAANRRPVVVVRDGLQPVPDVAGATNPTAQLATPDGPVTAVLPDSELSQLFSAPASAGLGSVAEARQLLLARLAIAAQHDPGAPSHLLLSTARDWYPSDDEAGKILTAIDDAPFIDLQPLSRLLGAPVSDVSRAEPPAAPELAPGQLTVKDLTDLLNLSERIEVLSRVVPDPDQLTLAFRTGFAAITSTTWRTDLGERADAIAAVEEQGRALLAGLSIVPGSNVNLISDRGDLPVTVSNDLDQDVTVEVSLQPDDNRLSIDSAQTVTIPARSASSLNFPATAIGSGDVLVQVEVRAPAGPVITQPSEFTVRVRADWENVGTAVLGALLGVALLFGVIRTIRRGKRPTRMEPIQPPDTPGSAS